MASSTVLPRLSRRRIGDSKYMSVMSYTLISLILLSSTLHQLYATVLDPITGARPLLLSPAGVASGACSRHMLFMPIFSCVLPSDIHPVRMFSPFGL